MALLSTLFLTPISSIPHALAQPNATQPAINNPAALRDTLADVRLDAAKRLDAAITLLASGDVGINLLAIELSPSQDPETHLLIAQAANLSAAPAPPEFIQPALNLVPDADPILLPELASLLGRYDDPRIVTSLLAIAQNEKLPPDARRGPIIALGYHRRPDIARVLFRYIQPDEHITLRRAAFDAMANLTGVNDLGYDLARWSQWWEQHRKLSDAEWLAVILDNHTRLAHVNALQLPRLEDRLTELYRPLYRATPAADRPALLASMLADPIEAIRLLAIDLTLQWLTDTPPTDTQPVNDVLRTALRSRFDDPSPVIRQGAARLLRDLRDEAAATVVETKLVDGSESDPDVLHAYLQVMARMPRRNAIGPMTQMLSDPLLRNDAAGALAESVAAGQVDQAQSLAIARRLDESTRGRNTPEPRVIALLGKLGQIADWKRLASWMDDTSQDVREAAANVWAQSGQPLTELASRAADPVIRRIFVDAVGRRGDSPGDFERLIELRPSDGVQLAAWQRSAIAMASRVPAQAILAADARLLAAGEDTATRDKFLSAAIDRDEPQHAPRDMTLLLLTRGELRLVQGDTNQAMADLLAIDAAQLQDPALRRRHRLALFRTRLATGEIESAFSLASEALTDTLTTIPERSAIVDELLAAAQRQITTGQIESARALLQRLRSLLSAQHITDYAQRLSDIEIKAGLTPPPTTAPAPTTMP